MTNRKYRLSHQEITQEIHRVIKDRYPRLTISGDEVRSYVERLGGDDSDLIFKANSFSLKNGLEAKKFIEEIFIDLQIEFEKNWHDRVYFRILKDSEKITFEQVDGTDE